MAKEVLGLFLEPCISRIRSDFTAAGQCVWLRSFITPAIHSLPLHNGTNGGNNRMLNFCMAIKGIKSSFRKPNQNGCQSFNSA